MSQNVVVSGFILPRNKQIRIALREVYGVGHTRALEICKACNFHEYKKVSELTEEEVLHIRSEVNKFVVGEELRNGVMAKIMRLSNIGCRRGVRRQKGLPVRGQRTKTNSKTSRRMRGVGMASAINMNVSNARGNKAGKNSKKNTKNTTKKKKK